MLGKKSLLIILCSILFFLVMLNPSFAINNETDTQSISHDLVKLSASEYYFDASTIDEEIGSEEKPFKDFKEDNVKSGTVNHFKNGEYHLENNLNCSDISFIGEDVDKTIINCNGHYFDITKNLKLINITLKNDFTIINRGTLTAENTVFDGGYALSQGIHGNSFGGAIYTPYDLKNSTVNIDNCTFKECIAEYGGAIYMDGGELNIKNSTFINNAATNYGGAIAAEYYSKININNTEFINDKSLNDAGGAIYLKEASLNARYLEVTNSTATFGAAITALNSTIHLFGLTLKNNTANYEGGAIYQLYGSFFMQQSRLINNVARNGGAIFIDDVSSLEMPNNIFENNTAKISAGAAYILLSPKINTNLNKFRNNIAQFYNDTYETNVYDTSNIGVGEYEVIVDENTDFDGNLPNYYSLLDKGWVTSIKNQYYGGNCWAFSTLASLESCILKATGKKYNLSEENMKNLIQLYSDYGLNLDTNDGGYISTGIGYLTSWLGPINEIDDIYDDYSVLSPLINSIMHVQNVILLKRNNYTDNDAIKEALIRYGAVGTGIGYYSDYLNSETNAYYCVYGNINHAVTIVGWNDTYSKSNFLKTPEGDGAWIVKNSWGDDWGDNGYFYVSYYDWNIAKVGMMESSFTFILNDSMKYDKNYQYDVCGKTSYSTAHNETIWYKNLFTATANESLAAVSTYFEKESNWTVSIFVEDVLKLIKNGTSKAGYYTINLDELIPINIGDKFNIVFQVKSTDSTRVPISEVSGSNKFLSKEGISYFSYDGKIWNDLYTSLSPSVACIKAFTIIDKLNTTMNLKVNYDEFNPVEIIVTVNDEYGRIIKNGNITLIMDDTEFNITMTDGYLKLNHNFTNSGLNKITAIFNSIPYNTCNKSYEFNLIKTLMNLDITITHDKNNVDINLNTSDKINSTIKLLINDKEENINLINGIGNLKLTNLNNGLYNIAAFIKDSIYEGNKTTSFKINYTQPIENHTINPNNEYTNIENNSLQPINNEKINLKLIKTVKTISKKAKKLILKASLKINGKQVKSKKLIFKFNGKKYIAKTNKKGIAKVTIKKNIIKKLKIGKKINYQVSYGKIIIKKILKVKK